MAEPASGPGPADRADGPPSALGTPALPEPVLSRQNRLRMSLVWVVPVVALVIGAVLVVRAILDAGPELGIEFRSAEGIEPGRTELRFKEVVVGRVKRVTIRPDRQKVHVVVSLDKSVANIAVADTRFWVVRPRIGTGGISGLGTLLSGAYIAVDAGESGQSERAFVGLDSPPLVLRGEPGRNFVLRATDLGSLDVGSPVYHRRIRVGRVVGYALSPDGKGLEVQVFVDAPHDRLVTSDTHFWNASGVDVALNASGLTVNTQSVASLLAGGLAFAALPSETPAQPAPAGTAFQLYDSERDALAPDDGTPLRVRMEFGQSLRGLDAGAPLDLLGVEVGRVRSIALRHDPRAGQMPIEVVADIFPRRLGRLREHLASPGLDGERDDRLLLKRLVEHGLRAQVRTGNLLTGRLFVALEFAPKARPQRFDAAAEVPTLPTIPGTLADLQPQVAEIVGRLAKVRFDEIGADLQGTIKSLSGIGASLQSTLGSAETMIKQLTPEAQRTLVETQKTLGSVQQALDTAQQTLRSAESNLVDPQAPLQRSVGQSLAELQRAAQAVRVLADYLQRHPESILRGKPPDPPPVAPTEGAR